MNIVSSALWVTYSQLVTDTPVMVRGSCDLVLFIISALYILYNRHLQNNNNKSTLV
jgi:hypothetical protein